MATTSLNQASLPLPGAGGRPQADVVIYDGHCRICTAQMERLARWDTRRALAFVSLHDPVVAERYPDLSHDALMQQMVVIDPAGQRHWGAAALRQIARRVPRLWWLVPILSLPGTLPLWQSLYGVVARNRYRFGRRDACTDGSCQLHYRR